MTFNAVAERRRVFKFPFNCIIVRPGQGKPEFVVADGDRVFINKDGNLEKISEGDINAPNPKECPEVGCTEPTRRRRICPVHGDVTDVGE